GVVYGIDASPEMVDRAAKKAAKADAAVIFRHAAAQALPFSDAQFDVALSMLMLHHLPNKARRQSAGEAKRVLKRGGPMIAIDFGSPMRIFGPLYRGHVKLGDIIAVLGEAGMEVVESGKIGAKNLRFAPARVPYGS